MSPSPPLSRVFLPIPTAVPGRPFAISSSTGQTTRGHTRATQRLAVLSSIAQSHATATDTEASAAIARWVRNTELNLLGSTRGSYFDNAHPEARAHTMNEYAAEDKENYVLLPLAREVLCSQSQVFEGNLTALDARLEVLRRETQEHGGASGAGEEFVGDDVGMQAALSPRFDEVIGESESESDGAMPMTDRLNILGFLNIDADFDNGSVEDEDSEDAGSEVFSDEEELEDDDEDDWEDGCDVNSDTGSIHIRLSCA
ncbi:hypothetical protein K438DRAFT_1952451 [Mycena galopus ATCC 62051]|nr:hypothetical protein K438DRAFT_1952451 [Mycena galopus ATCC 62051]